MGGLSGVFGPPPQPGTVGQVTTAHALALFYSELVTRGFPPEFAESATLAAVAATITRYDLTVAPDVTQDTQTPT